MAAFIRVSLTETDTGVAVDLRNMDATATDLERGMMTGLSDAIEVLTRCDPAAAMTVLGALATTRHRASS